jgi:hypothetical protein
MFAFSSRGSVIFLKGTIMEVLKTAVSVVAVLTATGGTIYAGVNELNTIRKESDAKYVPLSDWQDFQWAQLRKELRQIEKDIAEAEFEGDTKYARKLEEEYEELLEFICRKYPEDRNC